ncbi:unnamed protein product, partial [Microthlaspi erraticum]
MERFLAVLLVLIATLAIIHIGQAQSPSQQGFISLDCGLPGNEPSPYTDAGTELQFYSDATYIQSGKTGTVASNLESMLMKPYATVRFFPEGRRNCYNLPVEKGRKHLVRAWFFYGNYDGRDVKPKFALYLGPNPWATIDLEEQVNGTRVEILHIPTSNSLQICLVKTGETTPMISALEIRPMGNNSYITNSGSLSLYFRVYLTKSEKYIRKPDDQYYLYSHFAEIQDLRDDETREFNMVWNDEVMSTEPVIPDKLEITTMLSVSPRTCARGQCKFQLIRTNRSTLPPLLNALEVFTVIQFPQSETNETEVAAMRNIESTYGLSRINWQGDPCFPQQLRWDALDCSNTDIFTPPRITS